MGILDKLLRRNPTMEPLINIPDAAVQVGVAPATLYQLTREKIIPATWLGTQRRKVLLSDVRRVIGEPNVVQPAPIIKPATVTSTEIAKMMGISSTRAFARLYSGGVSIEGKRNRPKGSGGPKVNLWNRKEAEAIVAKFKLNPECHPSPRRGGEGWMNELNNGIAAYYHIKTNAPDRAGRLQAYVTMRDNLVVVKRALNAEIREAIKNG
jgi:hypothetical protein